MAVLHRARGAGGAASNGSCEGHLNQFSTEPTSIILEVVQILVVALDEASFVGLTDLLMLLKVFGSQVSWVDINLRAIGS